MGQELKIRHCVLKIKVNTNLIVGTGPNKAYIILQLKFYHHSGSSNSESQFQVLTGELHGDGGPRYCGQYHSKIPR